MSASERNRESERDRERERKKDKDREKERKTHTEREREREREIEREREREEERAREKDRERVKERDLGDVRVEGHVLERLLRLLHVPEGPQSQPLPQSQHPQSQLAAPETEAKCATPGRSQDICKGSRFTVEGERCVVSS